jgi:uracil-DNA glycosylase
MQRCPLCPNVHKCVPADGPETSQICFIGEAPNREDNSKLRPFVGKTGQEVNQHYLPLAGLRRDRVWFSNAISCLPPGTGKLDPKRTADLALLESCTNFHLFPALRRIKPKLIVAMGSFACRAIDPDINLEFQHGIVLDTKWGKVMPFFHPALGLHTPKSMLYIRNDWVRLRKYLQHKLLAPVDEFAGNEDYRAIENEDEIHETLQGWQNKPLACDTENTKDRSPYCITYSVQPGTGYLIQAHNHSLLATFQQYLDEWKGRILWHNWLHDMEIVEKMNLRFNEALITDTMLKVFHLGNMPQGLKALAYRELGMEMQDFDDLVRPYSTQRVIQYFREAYCEEWEAAPEELVRDKNGQWKIYKPQSFRQKLKRFFTDFEKNPDKDVFDMWHKNWDGEQEMVQKKCGEFPGLCISHVPFKNVIAYATRDADALIRLYPIILHMQSRVRKTVQENWGEYT